MRTKDILEDIYNVKMSELSHNWRYEIKIKNNTKDVCVRGRYDYWGDKAQYFEIVGTKGTNVLSTGSYELYLNDKLICQLASKEEITNRFNLVWRAIPTLALKYYEPYHFYYLQAINEGRI